MDLAYAYCREAALMDLDDLEHNLRDGVHIAALAGAWLSLVAGFGGMRDHGGQLSFAPRLPGHLTRLAFRFCFQGQRLTVEIVKEHATYTMADGDTLTFTHHGSPVTVTRAKPVTMPIAQIPKRQAPKQPRGREPRRAR